MTTAEKILVIARSSNPGRPVGIVTHGAIVVEWDRTTKRYEIGTEARVLATGKRSEVLPTLAAMLKD